MGLQAPAHSFFGVMAVNLLITSAGCTLWFLHSLPAICAVLQEDTIHFNIEFPFIT